MFSMGAGRPGTRHAMFAFQHLIDQKLTEADEPGRLSRSGDSRNFCRPHQTVLQGPRLMIETATISLPLAAFTPGQQETFFERSAA